MSSRPGDKIYFPGLNGIRALAALGVLVSHTLASLSRFGISHPRSIQFANAGVTIFFTLSGFLITYLLLQEKKKHGRIDLKQFYIRRVLRIWPLYFLYILLTLSVTTFALGESQDLAYLALYFVFFPNIAFNLNRYPMAMGHLWSIGVEEQFYAFWPLILSKVARIVRFLVVLVIGMIAVRLALKLYGMRTGHMLPYGITTSMRFDCMAIGALFAIAYDRDHAPTLRLGGSILAPLAFWGVVVLACLNRLSMFSMLDHDVVAIVTGFFILSQISSPARWSLLENPVMSFLGIISYGIYVYHPLVIEVVMRGLGSLGVRVPNAYVAVASIALLTTGVAWLSYRLLEGPFLRLKARFSPILSSGTRPA